MAAPATTPTAATSACASTAGRATTAATTLTTAAVLLAIPAPRVTTEWPRSTASAPSDEQVQTPTLSSRFRGILGVKGKN